MSLDKFVKPDKKQEGTKEPQKPPAKPTAVKEDNPKKPAAKATAKKKTKPAKNAVDLDDVEAQGQEDGIDAKAAEEMSVDESTPPKQSALKAMGMVKYALVCPACKYKKELLVAGEPRAHQLLCKKCGGQMKAGKKG